MTATDELRRLPDEVADTPKCETCEAMLDCDECLRADASQKERKRLDYENAKLRELVRGLWYCTENENKAICEGCPLGTVEGDRLALACEKLMYELGVDA